MIADDDCQCCYFLSHLHVLAPARAAISTCHGTPRTKEMLPEGEGHTYLRLLRAARCKGPWGEGQAGRRRDMEDDREHTCVCAVSRCHPPTLFLSAGSRAALLAAVTLVPRISLRRLAVWCCVRVWPLHWARPSRMPLYAMSHPCPERPTRLNTTGSTPFGEPALQFPQ